MALVAWLTAALAALAPAHLSRAAFVTLPRADGVVVAWRTDRPSHAAVDVDGRVFDAGVTAAPRVSLAGLSPGRRYTYSVRAGARRIGGGSFRTDPGPDGDATLAVFGDYGAGTPAERAVARLVAGWHPDVLVAPGDNVYPFAVGGFLFDANVFRPLAPVLSQAAFVPALGNHDVYLDGGAAFLAATGLPRDYSVRYGAASLVVFDSDADVAPASAQGRFLAGAVRRARSSCFRFAVFHHPPFSPHSEGIAPRLRRDVVPLLVRWGFQAALMGHVHSYERSVPQAGVTYLTVGTGGAEIERYQLSTVPDAQRVESTYGALRLRVGHGRAIGDFFDVTGRRRDSFTLTCGTSS